MHSTSEIQEKEITFLDLIISVDIGGRIQTDIYRKPTATNSFLEWQSYHPIALKRGIPVGQYLRAAGTAPMRRPLKGRQRIFTYSSLIEDTQNKNLIRAYWRAKHSTRESLLINEPVREEVKDRKIRCIGTYDGHTPEIMSILKRYWPILTADSDLKEALSTYPTITYRRGSNLRDYLVHSLYQEKSETLWLKSNLKGSYLCGTCSFCKFLPRIKEFTIPREGKKLELRQFFNCKSKGIVYVATCTCLKLYIGKTIQEFRRRISKHISSIHRRDFHRNDSSVLKFWGISQIKIGKRKENL